MKQLLLKRDGLPQDFMNVLLKINSINMDNASHSVVGLLDELAKTQARMDGRSQQDSHEALTILLDLIHHDVSRSSVGMKSSWCPPAPHVTLQRQDPLCNPALH